MIAKILSAEDDLDDCEILKEAMKESRFPFELSFVHDGEELISALKASVRASHGPLPGIILLDLNMPRKDGYEALAEIKSDPNLKHIPVIVLTTSHAEKDVFRTYSLGVSSYISKPVSFQAWLDLIQTLMDYWFKKIQLPSHRH